jgi:hypothetical protein
MPQYPKFLFYGEDNRRTISRKLLCLSSGGIEFFSVYLKYDSVTGRNLVKIPK